MSATQQPAAAAPINLADLHMQAQRRVTWAAYQHHAQPYSPLQHRFDQVMQYGTLGARAALAADLTELLTAPDEVLKRMVYQQATNARCMSPATQQALALAGQIEVTRQAAELTRPKITPAEMVMTFASRGITITGGPDGNLHITPANRLSEADRQLLLGHKAGILEALTAAAEII